MPRYRTIKPEFWPSEQVMALSIPARLCFIGMWNFCDDFGVHPASCRTLGAEVFPGDGIAVKEIQRLVDEMIRHDLILLFQDERGKSFWLVTGWHHQVINRPSKSRHAIPPTGAKPANKGNSGETLTEHSLSNHGAITDTSLSTHNRDEMNRDEMNTLSQISLVVNNPEQKKDEAAQERDSFSSFVQFWDAYPRKVNKGTAIERWKKVKPSERPAVMAGLEAKKRCADWIKDGGKYIPHPATWLSARGWEDEDCQPKPEGEFDMSAFLREKGGYQ